MSGGNQDPKEFMTKEESSVKTIGLVLLIAIMFTSIVYLYAINNDAIDTMEKASLENRMGKMQEEIDSLKNSQGDASLTQANAISGWKTYENEKLGYQIQYPSDWTASDEGKSDPQYPYDMELTKEYTDAGEGYEYNMGITSRSYGTSLNDGTLFNKDAALKDLATNKDAQKIAIAGEGEAYYRAEETLGGGTHWMVSIIGDKGAVAIECSFDDSTKEALYRQVISTFRFN